MKTLPDNHIEGSLLSTCGNFFFNIRLMLSGSLTCLYLLFLHLISFLALVFLSRGIGYCISSPPISKQCTKIIFAEKSTKIIFVGQPKNGLPAVDRLGEMK